MKNKSKYWKEFLPKWWGEIKSWIDFKNLKQTISNFVITIGSLLVLFLWGKIEILTEELWVQMAAIRIFVIWMAFLVIYNFIVAGKKLFDEKQEIINKYEKEGKRISVNVIPDNYTGQQELIYEQIALINGSEEDLISCFLLLENISKILSDGTKENISPKSNRIPWAISDSNKSNALTTLHRGIAERIPLIMIDYNENKAYLVGLNYQNTLLPSIGKYIVQIRLCGSDFSPHMFSVTFELKENNEIEILKTTNVSLILFGGNVDFNSSIKIEPNLTVKDKK